ncbi:hypothetical protein CAL14_10730 [Bordetella genomosp. 9]|uniref:response regulator n=1 Tax=Bordetella genomosp. 9 TaxID=1416803 RepID=UPI000A296D86|nr:response regulator [Bordetella genomosp. 9]ARP90710.1 hypothetical protein CAL14_10730 [Bordetella genomosp. 9]
MNDSLDLRVFVVEDDATVALLIEDMLDELGCRVVASIARLSRAFEAADAHDFDVAILDVNVGGEQVFPFAEHLRERGKPFVFSTGYGRAGIPAPLASRPVLAKPFSIEDLARAISAAMQAGGKPA